MTDRINALTVVLDRDIREDDVEWIVNAIRMVKGVLSVEPRVANMTDHIAKVRAEQEMKTRILAALTPSGNGGVTP